MVQRTPRSTRTDTLCPYTTLFRSKAMDVAARDLGEVVLDPKEKHSAYVLRFPNDRRIHSMSSNPDAQAGKRGGRSEEHTSELQSLMRISYAVFCLKKKKRK